MMKCAVSMTWVPGTLEEPARTHQAFRNDNAKVHTPDLAPSKVSKRPTKKTSSCGRFIVLCLPVDPANNPTTLASSLEHAGAKDRGEQGQRFALMVLQYFHQFTIRQALFNKDRSVIPTHHLAPVGPEEAFVTINATVYLFLAGFS